MTTLGTYIRTGDLVGIVESFTAMHSEAPEDYMYVYESPRPTPSSFLSRNEMCLVLTKKRIGSSLKGWVLFVFTGKQVGWILDLDVYMPLGMSDGR